MENAVDGPDGGVDLVLPLLRSIGQAYRAPKDRRTVERYGLSRSYLPDAPGGGCQHIRRDVRWLATKRKSPERLKGDPDVTADELQAAIDRAEAKRRELIDVRPAERESARVLTMLPKAAEFYRDQIDRGLGGDLVAAAKARTILRELLGEIMLLPGEDGSLWAEYAMQPAALLQGAGTGGRGDSICRVPAVPLDERLK